MKTHSCQRHIERAYIDTQKQFTEHHDGHHFLGLVDDTARVRKSVGYEHAHVLWPAIRCGRPVPRFSMFGVYVIYAQTAEFESTVRVQFLVRKNLKPIFSLLRYVRTCIRVGAMHDDNEHGYGNNGPGHSTYAN